MCEREKKKKKKRVSKDALSPQLMLWPRQLTHSRTAQAECGTCHASVLRSEQSLHVHCTSCDRILTSADLLLQHVKETHAKAHKCELCGTMLAGEELDDHVRSLCAHTLHSVR